MLKHIKEMKKNHPNEYGQFIFGITIAAINLFQIVAVVLLYVFH